MPFVENAQDNEEEKNPNGPSAGPVSPVGGGGAVHLAPSSAIAPAGGGATSGGPSPNAAGGQFASLNQYVTANQEQAVPLANKITSGITNQYNDLSGKNASTVADVNTQVSGGYTPENSAAMSAEAANPVSFASDPNNVKQFQSLLNNTYSGPTSAEGTTNFTNQQNSINQAIAAGQQQTGTEAGRKQLLTQQEVNPTGGVTALDSAILSQSPEALGKVENAYQPFGGLLTDLQTGAQGVDQNIAQGQSTAASTSKAANDAIAQQTKSLNSELNTNLTNAQNNVSTYNKDIGALNTAASGYNTDINAFLAANPNIKNPTNADLSPWMNLQTYTGSPTLANVATPGEYATAGALQALNGTNNVGTGINASTASQAGTALPPDYQKMLDALNNGSVPTAMKNELQGISGQITGAVTPLTALQQAENQRSSLTLQSEGLSQQLRLFGQTIAYNQKLLAANPDAPAARKQDLQDVIDKMQAQIGPLTLQQTTANNQLQGIVDKYGYNQSYFGDIGRMAQGLQWVPGAANNYNKLLTQLQANLAPVSQIQLPSTTAPGSGGLTTQQQANIGAGAALGPVGAVSSQLAGDLYNKVVADPESAATRAALFFPTLGTSLVLPDSVIKNIGNDINGVVNSIGDFFGGLF